MADKEKNNTNKEDIERLKKELKEEIKKEMEDERKKESKSNNFEDKAKETIDKIMDTEDSTKDYNKKDIESNKGLAMLSYFGPLALIPFLVSKDSKFAMYHAKQGLNLFIIELIVSAASFFLTSIIRIPKMCTIWGETTYECGMITPWWLSIPISLIESLLLVVAIIGIVYSCQGKAKELPVLGKIKIVK